VGRALVLFLDARLDIVHVDLHVFCLNSALAFSSRSDGRLAVIKFFFFFWDDFLFFLLLLHLFFLFFFLF